MADIDVVPKRRTNTWLWWILAAMVIAVILFMLFSGASDPRSGVTRLLDAPYAAAAAWAA